MSDRLAVFNQGRIEQVGTPAEVYELPATGFVAGFVGVSNVLSGEAAEAITGDAHAFTIRPEKIAMAGPAGAGRRGRRARQPDTSARSYTWVRSRATSVELDLGGNLVVMQQNLATSSMEALQVRGRAVRLVWSRENNRLVEAPAGADGSDEHEEEAR